MFAFPARPLCADDAWDFVEEDFDGTEKPLAAKLAANVRLQMWRLAVFTQKARKYLQGRQRLSWRTLYPEVQMEAVEACSPTLLDGLHIVHCNDRITAD
jgi:hypothetical protein